MPGDLNKLLTDTVACAQDLLLNNRKAITKLCHSQEEEGLIVCGFWMLYAIEKPYRMRMGQPSVRNSVRLPVHRANSLCTGY